MDEVGRAVMMAVLTVLTVLIVMLKMRAVVKMIMMK
jgi:hypothetical protein